MIELTRVRTKSAIPSGLRGTKLIEKNLAVLKLKRELGEIPSKKFKSTFWKPAKKQLRKESNGKCAYCEADTSVVAHGDVEHFRPKNIYWWLPYCYDNYLYSCQICNQTFKSNHFPIGGTKLKEPTVTSTTSDTQLTELAKTLSHDPLDEVGLEGFDKNTKKEKAHLIDPYFFDPEKLLIWEADDVLKQVKVKIANGVAHRAKMQIALEKFYGLNREELCKVRYQDYSIALTLAKSKKALAAAVGAGHALVAEVDTKLSEMKAANHRFAGMIRFLVK